MISYAEAFSPESARYGEVALAEPTQLTKVQCYRFVIRRRPRSNAG